MNTIKGIGKIVAGLALWTCLILATGCASIQGLIGKDAEGGDGFSSLVKLGDGKLLGVTIPQPIMDAGERAVRGYVETRYPQAAPYLDQLFPKKAAGQETISVPITTTYAVTVKLTNGTFIAESEVANIFVEPRRSYVMPTLLQPEPVAYSPQTFKAMVLGAPAGVDPTAPITPEEEEIANDDPNEPVEGGRPPFGEVDE